MSTNHPDRKPQLRFQSHPDGKSGYITEIPYKSRGVRREWWVGIRRSGGDVVAYTRSRHLYAYGATQQEALRELVKYGVALHNDLRREPEKIGRPAEKLLSWLNQRIVVL
jgi:hypothetical protein